MTLTKKGMNAMVDAAPGHAMLVKRLFSNRCPMNLSLRLPRRSNTSRRA